MVRISDILKQQSGQIPEPDETSKEKKEEQASKAEKIMEGIQFAKAIPPEGPKAEDQMQVVKAMHQMQINPEESERIYNCALEVMKKILDEAQSGALLDLTEASEIVKDIVDRIVLGDRELISLIANPINNNYLCAHSVNVCVLSIGLGLALGYNKSKLNELGLGALLHDLGMTKVMDIAKQPRMLKEDEYEEIKKHPIYSTDILSKIKDIQEGVTLIAKQVHERMNGTGYPAGLKGHQIHEYAKIIAIADVYDALIHSRAHRPAIAPHEAIKELLVTNYSDLFEKSILKILINRIGLYPVGNWVELNTGEIGKVISSNEESPLRPKVNIFFGPDKEKLSQIKSMDLLHHTALFIKQTINPQELNLKLG